MKKWFYKNTTTCVGDTVHIIQAMVNKFLYSITNCNTGKFCKEEIFLIETVPLYIIFTFCIIFAL